MATKLPNTRQIPLTVLVRKAWGEEWHKKEVVYKFSNGRQFLSTDQGTSGVYRSS